MKRVRPAASIEEWVACHVAMAVKKATESKKIAALERELNSVRKQLANCGKDNMDLENELKRYEDNFLKTLSDLGTCNNCARYWSTSDLFNCEGGCGETKCDNCVTIKECDQCGESMCEDCLSCCEQRYCYLKICSACYEKNTDCAHRMCEKHSSPCTKCPVPAFANSSSSSSSEK